MISFTNVTKNFGSINALDNVTFTIDSGESSILFKNLIMEGKLSGFEERLTKTTGDLTIIIRGGRIARLPDMPLVGEIKDIDIQKGSFILKFRSGKILIERGSLDTSWFKFSISGMIRLSDIIGLSNLDLKLCAISQEKFADKFLVFFKRISIFLHEILITFSGGHSLKSLYQ